MTEQQRLNIIMKVLDIDASKNRSAYGLDMISPKPPKIDSIAANKLAALAVSGFWLFTNFESPAAASSTVQVESPFLIVSAESQYGPTLINWLSGVTGDNKEPKPFQGELYTLSTASGKADLNASLVFQGYSAEIFQSVISTVVFFLLSNYKYDSEGLKSGKISTEVKPWQNISYKTPKTGLK